MVGVQHFMTADKPLPESAAPVPPPPADVAKATQKKPAKAPPEVVDEPEARRIVQQTLDAVGVRSSAIRTGSYRLIGPGRAPDDVLPLLSFTCPQTHPCSRVFLAL